MSLATAKHLGYNDFIECNRPLALADGSMKKTLKKLMNLPLMIREVLLPFDFLVMEMDRDAKETLLLGRPFLASARCIFNCKSGVMDLRLAEGVVMHFETKRREPTEMKHACSLEFYDTTELPKDTPSGACYNDGESFHGVCLITLFNEPTASVKRRPNALDMRKEPKSQTPNLGILLASMTLKPIFSLAGEEIYKARCKGMTKPFAYIKVINKTKLTEMDCNVGEEEVPNASLADLISVIKEGKDCPIGSRGVHSPFLS